MDILDSMGWLAVLGVGIWAAWAANRGSRQP